MNINTGTRLSLAGTGKEYLPVQVRLKEDGNLHWQVLVDGEVAFGDFAVDEDTRNFLREYCGVMVRSLREGGPEYALAQARAHETGVVHFQLSSAAIGNRSYGHAFSVTDKVLREALEGKWEGGEQEY